MAAGNPCNSLYNRCSRSADEPASCTACTISSSAINSGSPRGWMPSSCDNERLPIPDQRKISCPQAEEARPWVNRVNMELPPPVPLPQATSYRVRPAMICSLTDIGPVERWVNQLFLTWDLLVEGSVLGPSE